MKKLIWLGFFILTMLLVVGIYVQSSMPKAPPIENGEPDACVAACANLQRLGCVEANALDLHLACSQAQACASGSCNAANSCEVSCVQFCRDTLHNGVNLKPSCAAQITNCAALADCQ